MPPHRVRRVGRTGRLTLVTPARTGLVVLLALGTVLSVLPDDPIPDELSLLSHVLGFTVLGFLVMVGFESPAGRVGALIALSAVGGGLELWQMQLPARTPSLVDAGANAVGILSGLLVDRVMGRLGRRRRGTGPGYALRIQRPGDDEAK